MTRARVGRRSGKLEDVVGVGCIVGALAVWLAAGEGRAAEAAVPKDMSIQTAPAAEDRVARLLAGLPGGEDARVDRAMPGYAKRVDRAFARFEAKVGAPMQAWAKEALAQSPGETVFYPFAGADFPTARRMYPDASRYVLVAMQRGGRPPALDGLEREALGELLAGYHELLTGFLGRGFFITREMNEGTDKDAAIRGITGLLMVFAAREGHEVLAVEPVKLADDGSVVVHDGDRARASTWDSVRLRLRRRSDGAPVTLEYLRVGLSNLSLKPDSAPRALVAGLADDRVILKAASHLPQDPNFSVITRLLLAQAPTIVQDETGVAYDDLTARFAVSLYGNFGQVNLLFAEEDQNTLVEAYRVARDVPRLPFHVGYRKGTAACLLVATRAPVTAAAAPAGASPAAPAP
jgi:hypothetical protein